MLKEFIDCGRALVAVLEGEIDQRSASALRERIDIEYELNGKPHLVLDLTGVTFMDSAGIGLIIGRWKNVASAGGKLALAATGRKLIKILELGGVTRLVKICPNYRKAVEECLR